MARLVGIDDQTAKLLRDVIDMHLEGVVEAKKQTVDDPTVQTADELLELMAGYDDDMRALLTFRDRIA